MKDVSSVVTELLNHNDISYWQEHAQELAELYLALLKDFSVHFDNVTGNMKNAVLPSHWRRLLP